MKRIRDQLLFHGEIVLIKFAVAFFSGVAALIDFACKVECALTKRFGRHDTWRDGQS